MIAQMMSSRIRGAMRTTGVLARAAPVARACGRALLKQPARRTLCADAKAAESKGIGWLLKEGQVDSGFWQGTGLLAATLGAITFTSEETRKSALVSLMSAYRACGLEAQYVDDKRLIEDYVKKYSVAALNVLMASPVFYFSFARVVGSPLSVCCVRALTGSLRITPFMFFFYGFFAVASPFACQYLMRAGAPYAEARDNGAMYIFPPLIFVESVVELRGCGVTFAQMTPSSFLIFIPALVGRLITGIVTQTNKVGQEESLSLLPDSWNTQDAPTWQQHTYLLFDKLALDREFVVTCAGTSVFQHILNGVTFVLLTHGSKSTLGQIGAFLAFGLNGTLLSGVSQFGKTFMMRLGFGWAWNWCSTMSNTIELPVYDEYTKAK